MTWETVRPASGWVYEVCEGEEEVSGLSGFGGCLFVAVVSLLVEKAY